MLYTIKNREDLENLKELASLKNQVEDLRKQDIKGKQNVFEIVKKFYEPLTKRIKDTFRDITRTMTKISINNKEATENFNENVLELMKDKGMIAPYLASSSVNHFKTENASHFIFKKDPNSIRMKVFLTNKGIPVTLNSKMLTFRGSNKSFKLDGGL